MHVGHMKRREDHPNRERIAKELRKGEPLTKFDLELRCFLALRNVNAYLKIMHEAGEIHIHSYRRDSPHGSPTTVWIWGAGTDAKRPKPQTSAAKSRKYRKLNPEAVIREIMRKRRKREVKRAHANGIHPNVGSSFNLSSLLRIRSSIGKDQ
jgi:hypothetical protein